MPDDLGGTGSFNRLIVQGPAEREVSPGPVYGHVIDGDPDNRLFDIRVEVDCGLCDLRSKFCSLSFGICPGIPHLRGTTTGAVDVGYALVAGEPGRVSDFARSTESRGIRRVSAFRAEIMLDIFGHSQKICAWGTLPIMMQPDRVISPISMARLTDRSPMRLMFPAVFSAFRISSSVAGQFP